LRRPTCCVPIQGAWGDLDGSGIGLAGGLELIYSRMGYADKHEDRIADIGEVLLNDKFADNLTFHFSALAEYRKEWKGFLPYAVVLFELL
jgi:hypothetical protein